MESLQVTVCTDYYYLLDDNNVDNQNSKDEDSKRILLQNPEGIGFATGTKSLKRRWTSLA